MFALLLVDSTDYLKSGQKFGFETDAQTIPANQWPSLKHQLTFIVGKLNN